MAVLTNFFPHLRPSRESEQLYITILAMQCLQFFSQSQAEKKQVYIVLTSYVVYTTYKAFHTLLAIVEAVNDHQ